jgi:predicted neuraminidase
LLQLSLHTSLNFLMAQPPPFKSGMVEDELIYDAAPFSACHADTIVERPKGLVTGFFRGTRERNADVKIYVCRKEGKKWTARVSVANGIQCSSLRYPTWNPVLYQIPRGD